VSLDFHARFDSVGKTYIYRIRNVKEMDIFQRNYCYQITDPLDVAAMQKAASYIEGTHDFACFQAAGGEERETTVRTVFQLKVERVGSEVYIIITGDGFLYNMVRIITGTLVEVGLGKRAPESVADTIKSTDRQKAGHTAPPQGLYLKKIYYDFKEVPGYDDFKPPELG
jgi:tRNA pseudouridine38-40 synthase